MSLPQQIISLGPSPSQLSDTTMKVIKGDPSAAKGSYGLLVDGVGKITPSKIQDVRVDNWGNYCLQRLQAMYEKSDSCDLTLQFQNLETIKVHRIVVNMCTEYFANLELASGASNSILVLPKELEYNSMLVIIKFFYTGKLEVRGAEFSDIYRTVKLMNINILIKLLEAHARKPEEMLKRKPTVGQLVMKTGGGGPQALKSLVHSALNANTVPGIRKPITVSRPLPAGVKTKTVLARVQQQPVRLAGFHNRANIRTTAPITPKKLPIWKERKPIIQTQHEPSKYISQKIEPPRPTRFEWPDPDEDPGGFKFPQTVPDDFTGLGHISTPIISQNPTVVFDAVKTQMDEGIGLKHKLPSEANGDGSNSKIAKISEDIEKELASMEEPEEVYEEVGFETNTEASSHMSQDMCQGVSEHTEVETSVEVTTSEPELILNDTMVDDLEPQDPLKSYPVKKVVKTVRFATDIEKETKEVAKEFAAVQHVPVPVINCTAMPHEEEPGNHSKLISEILKRYPELIKDNKNVKLKIVQKGPPDANSKEGKAKTSYIVLKSSSSDTPGSVVLKKSSASPARSKFWDTEDTVKKVSSAVENTIGPWSCVPCGTSDTPEHFDSYYLYRKHLVEVHHEKVDARICEYCGIKTSKRNLLLYHLYTKHAIEPPPSHQFPHCDQCDYVALSWSLLQKHKQAHATANAKQLSCTVCRASFKTNSALEYHMTANLHRNRDSKGQHQCPYCSKQFARTANLNTHIRSFHKDAAEEYDDIESDQNDSQQYQGDEETKIEVDELMSGDADEMEIIEGTHISIPGQIFPSSEADSLNKVASSIAAALGLGAQVHQEEEGYTEHILGDATQQVYVVEDSTTITSEGENNEERTIEVEGMEADFLVQDIHGNKFRKVTGTDSDGNPVVFFQLTDESSEMAIGEQAVEISEEVATTVANHVEYCFDEKSSLSVQNDHMYLDPQKCSIFLSSGGGVPVPVSMTSEEIEQTQTLITYAEDGTQVIEILPLTSAESVDLHNNANATENAENSEPTAEIIVPETEGEGTEGSELTYSINAHSEVQMEEVSYEGEMEAEELHEHDVVEIIETSVKIDDENSITGV